MRQIRRSVVLFYGHQVGDLINHSADHRSILPLYGLVHFFDTKCFDRVLLAFRPVDNTFDLGNFDLSHGRWYLRLAFEKLLHRDTTLLGDGLRAAQLLEGVDGSLDDVVGVRGSL